MNNLYFNIDGPTKITEKDFEIYKRLPRGITKSYEQMYGCWVSRYPTEGAARLCLRDLVRQRRYADTDLAYYELRTSVYYLACCHAEVQDGKEQFAKTMARRPELAKELMEELLYALERIEYLDVTSLLEVLFALRDVKTQELLMDEETRKKLLPYYKEWRLDGIRGTQLNEHVNYLLAQLEKQTVPDWLREIFLKEADDELKRELAALPKEMPEGMYGAFGSAGKGLDFPILYKKYGKARVESSNFKRAQAAEYLLDCPELRGHCFHGFEDDVKMMQVLARDSEWIGTVVRLMKSCCDDPVFWETRKECKIGQQRTLLYWMLGVMIAEMPIGDARPIMDKIMEILKAC